MAARLSISTRSRVAVSVMAALALLVAVMVVGFGVSALTSVTTTHARVAASQGGTSPAQSDSSCIWIGAHRAC